MSPSIIPQRGIRTLRHRARTFIGARPWLFFPIYRRRSAFDDLLVTPSTDLCIEGFPRSGNSFAVGAVKHAQSQPIQIAHHTHVPANAIQACEWGIPTLVLIRNPYDAVVSCIALGKQIQEEEHNADEPVQWVSYQDHLRAWIVFYRSLTSYRRRMLVARLDTVVDDMGNVIDLINDRYDMDFERFDHTRGAVAKVHAEQGYHAGPNERRAALKEETRTNFDEQLQRDSVLKDVLSEAERLYERFANEATTVSRS